MDVCEFTINMKALPKARPRVVKRRAHMPKRYMDYKEEFGHYARQHIDKKIEGDVSIDICFYFKTKKRGDIDNVAGGVMDALNGIAWDDDKQVTQLSTSIVNCDTNKIVVSIKAR